MSIYGSFASHGPCNDALDVLDLTWVDTTIGKKGPGGGGKGYYKMRGPGMVVVSEYCSLDLFSN